MLLLNPTKDFIIEPKPGSGISTALAIYALNKIRPEIEFTQVLWVSVNNESAIQAHKLLQALAQDLKANIQITISLEGCKCCSLVGLLCDILTSCLKYLYFLFSFRSATWRSYRCGYTERLALVQNFGILRLEED